MVVVLFVCDVHRMLCVCGCDCVLCVVVRLVKCVVVVSKVVFLLDVLCLCMLVCC